MNTMDALRLSVIDAGIAEGQRYAAKMEGQLEAMRLRQTIDECPLARHYLLCAASSYEAIARRIRQTATELNSTERN